MERGTCVLPVMLWSRGAGRDSASGPNAVNARAEGDQVDLPGLIREFRERADPKALGIDLGSARRARRQGLRQSEMAHLMGISTEWYRQLETGAAAWSEARLAGFARILKLSEAERFVLIKSAGWEPPPEPPESVRAAAGVLEADRAAVEATEDPALLLDRTFKVRVRNSAMGDLLPELQPGDNLMSWILASPVAQERLVNWLADWAIPTAAWLRTVRAVTERHLRRDLDVVLDVVQLANQDVAPQLWEEGHEFILTPTNQRGRVRVDNPERDGVHEEVTVRLWTSTPDFSPGWKILTMQPVERLDTRAQARAVEPKLPRRRRTGR